MRMFGFRPKKRQNLPKIPLRSNCLTLSLKGVLRSPGWHMKDNGHTLFFTFFVFLVGLVGFLEPGRTSLKNLQNMKFYF